MARLKGTRTEKNLLTAFTGESQARNRCTFFASQAKEDGYRPEGANAPGACAACAHPQAHFELLAEAW